MGKTNNSRSPDSAISEFLGVVAHRIHTPVGVIRWQVEALLDGMMGELTEEQKESLQSVMQSVENLNDFSRTMLYVYELEKDVPMMKPEEISLSSVVDRVSASLDALRKERENRIVCRAELPSFKITVDPDIAFTILRTLIENALQYGERKGEVHVKAEQAEGGLTVTVEDRGIGISSDMFPSIGSKFFRTPEARTIFPDGAGLNLFIAMNLAERTGGRITFESEEERGSRFRWFVPYTKRGRQPWQG